MHEIQVETRGDGRDKWCLELRLFVGWVAEGVFYIRSAMSEAGEEAVK